MAGKSNTLKTVTDLTAKQRKFVEIYATNYGNITKTEAARQAGYVAKDPHTIAAKLTNPNLNPHVVRYLEKRLSQELAFIEKNKLRSYKSFEDLKKKAIEKNQLATAVNAEYRIGQMAGFYINKSEVTVNGLEGMSREQLEKRLSELEKKIGEAKTIIDIRADEAETITEK